MARHAFRQLRCVLIFVSIFVNQRRRWLQRFDRIVHVGQFRIFDIDQSDRLVGNRFALGSDSRDRIAASADFVIGQDRLVFNPRADVNIFDVGAREHRMNAGKRFGFRRVDFNDARVRHRSAQHLSPQ